MRSFFHAFAAIANLAMALALVLLVLSIGPSRLEAESAPPPPEDGGIEPDPEVDASEPLADANLHPDAAAPLPPHEDSGCHIAAGGRDAASGLPVVTVVAFAFALAASRRRRKS